MEGASDSGTKKDRLARSVGHGIGTVTRAAARHPVASLVLVALVTAGFVGGLLNVEFEENLLLILPRGQPDTDASLNVSEHFPGHHSYVNVNWKIDPAKWDEANAKLPHRVPPEHLQSGEFVGKFNVTDEVYLRGLEYYYDWVQRPEYLPPGVQVSNIAYNAHVKLVNYTNTYNPASGSFDEAAYDFPNTTADDEMRFAMAWKTVHTSAPREVSTQASPDWDVTRSVYVYTPVNPRDKLDYNLIGGLAKKAFLDYRAAAERGEVEWDVFDLDASGPTDAKILDDAHGTELAREDIERLAPLVITFIFVTLWLAFRSWRAILIGTSSMILGAVWTYGSMGYLGIKLNSLNLTIVPLILGVGIDFSIHMVNEFLEARSRGKPSEDAFYQVGFKSGFSMFIATVTTVVGLGLMAVSPSLLVAQMGVLGALAITYTYVLSLLFIPAAFMLVGGASMKIEYTPSALMPRLARAVSRRRGVAALVVIGLTGGLYYGSTFLEYETFGNPARNFPEGDQVRTWFDEGQASFFGTKVADFESNWVILEGDMTTPESHDYIKALQAELRDNPRIRGDSVTGVTNLVEQWTQLKRGTAAAVPVLAQTELAGATGRPEADPYPATQEDIRQALDEMYACECMRVYASLFVNREYDISVILIDTATGGTYEGASDIMDEVYATIRSPAMEALRPPDVNVNVGGYTAFSVMFIEHQMPWLNYIGLASNLFVMALIFILFRNWRATLTLGALMGLTTIWWLGVLPTVGIGLAITLIIPLVFISAIGSDYGVHLIWSIESERDGWRAFQNSGKSVFFSVLTTFGAFALFVPVNNLMMRKAMLATTVAMAMIFLCTMLLVPLAYRVRAPEDPKEEDEEEAPPAAAASEEPMRSVPVTGPPTAPLVELAGPVEEFVVFGRAPPRR